MKWIKNRSRFLNEAKIKDIVLPIQRKEVSSKWSDKYLEYEEVEPTELIKQGKWKLSDEDKMDVLGCFFGSENNPIDMKEIFEIFEILDDDFVRILRDSIDTTLFRDNKEKYLILLEDFNPKAPTIDQISIIYEPIFRKLNVNETKADELIRKDENGRPVKDEDGNMIKDSKEKGFPVFEKNLVNIKSFCDAYNRCYDNQVDVDSFYRGDIANLVSLANENHNSSYKFDFEIFNRDLYLSIKHNAQDILNMAISKFFASCQHLYSGSYRDQLLGNVFDPNSIPAFLVFDTPIFWNEEKISDFLPLSRMIIRSIESFEDGVEDKIFFDRSYPDRMKIIFEKIVEKYSKNTSNIDSDQRETYIFTPDIDLEDSMREPYMDRLGIEKRPFIGVNVKSLHLNRNYDWSKIKISPKAKIKEMVIETNDLPENIFKINLNPDWIKFKFIKINDLSQFNSILTDSIAFDKCKFSSETINQWPGSDKIKKLQIVSCDVVDNSINLSNFSNLEELHLIYTIEDYQEVDDIIKNIKSLKKLVLSGDVVSGDGKKYVSNLKSKGLKIEIIGPVI